MLTKVRYFGKLVDPADYRSGFGFSGLLIRVANAIRISMERFIIMQLVKIDAKRSGIEGKALKMLLKQARNSPSVHPEVYHPINLGRLAHEGDVLRSVGRYSEGRKNDQPARPVRLDEAIGPTFAQFEQKTNRQARYVSGRTFKVYEEDSPAIQKEDENG